MNYYLCRNGHMLKTPEAAAACGICRRNAKKIRIHFSWMGAYWSCSLDCWIHLEEAVANYQALDLSKCRELKYRPHGGVLVLKENK